MKGQVFILAALAVAFAIFFAIPKFQEEIYLPKIDNAQLENIATQYNKWIAYTSIENYNILDFGNFVKQNYSYLEFIYLLTENKNVKIANYFDNPITCTINDQNLSISPNSYEEITFTNKIIFNSSFINFSYTPKNDYSGAIFLRMNSGVVKLELLKIFK